MGLRISLITGPRRSGKSSTIRAMIDHLCEVPPHYLRLTRIGSGKKPPSNGCKSSCATLGLASARWLNYDDDSIFDVTPSVLARIERENPLGSVLIEADADPLVHCACSYHHRVFVMSLPTQIHDVFRTPEEAAHALHASLNDTTSFGSEMFGIPLLNGSWHEEDELSSAHADLSDTQWNGFFKNPLGREMAMRVQLQPAFQALLDSDVIIVNAGVGRRTNETLHCIKRLDDLIDRLRGLTHRRICRFLCDIHRLQPDSAGQMLLQVLAPMCKSGDCESAL